MMRHVLNLSSSTAARQILSELSSLYCLRPCPASETPIHFFDTFDWGLYRADLSLERHRNEYRLRHLSDGDLVAETSCPSGQLPRFVDDFTPGELRRALAPHIKVRALLRLVTTIRQRQSVELLGDGKQPLARLTVDEFTIEHRDHRLSLESRVILQTEPEDRRTWQHLHRALQDRHLQHPEQPLLTAALSVAGITPAGYSNKLRVNLQPEMPTGEAVRTIARHLLHIMRRNEEGLQRDIDTEFLHHFRVADRRSRTLVALLPKAVPKDARRQAARNLAELSRVTGDLRDLDVLLLQRFCYTALLSTSLQDGLQELFNDLQRRRARDFAKVRDYLKSDRYGEIVRSWSSTLDDGPWFGADSSPQANRPVRTVADKLIGKGLGRVLKRGTAITAASLDSDLHRLRLACKKLRYTLEFFTSLYGRKRTAVPIKQLKRLQDNLGEFNDMSVQLAWFHGMLQDTDETGPSPLQAAAIGGLIQALNRRKLTVRDEFAAAFTRFSSADTREAFARLTGTERRPDSSIRII